jgi:hypothetical protein
MTDIAPRRVILFGGAQDGLELDLPIDRTETLVPEWDPVYAARVGAMHAYLGPMVLKGLKYRDSGEVNAAGLPIFVLVA